MVLICLIVLYLHDREELVWHLHGKADLNLRNAKYQKDDSPISQKMSYRSLNSYSKSYINHLINSNEILASMILTMNNLFFYQDLMKKIREAIKIILLVIFITNIAI